MNGRVDRHSLSLWIQAVTRVFFCCSPHDDNGSTMTRTSKQRTYNAAASVANVTSGGDDGQLNAEKLARSSTSLDWVHLDLIDRSIASSQDVMEKLQVHFPHRLIIATDGSRREATRQSGWGVVVWDCGEISTAVCSKLPDDVDIHAAETFAVRKAMTDHCQYSSVILCDRKGLLEEIIRAGSGQPVRPQTADLVDLRESLKEQGVDVDIVWVPSHNKLYINEFADFAAKLGMLIRDSRVAA